MRISDWSSDVCSSDLWRRPDFCEQNRVPRLLDRRYPCYPAPWLLRQSLRPRSGHSRHIGCRVFRRLRSEEHTSELQSLMRISYAFFCLKKKNLYTSLLFSYI